MGDLISVIIPVYNVEEYLGRCIDSIINQTYKNLEIILIDDGSTDESSKICEDYKKRDNRIKVFHKSNGGLSDARNYGIERATGNYLAFVDSDDFINEKMYEQLYKYLIKTKADIALCNIYLFNKESEIIYTNDDDVDFKVLTQNEILENLYENDLPVVVAWNKLYKKEIFEEIRYPKGKIIEDAFIIHEILDKINAVVWIEDEYYYYYQRNNSILHTYKINILDELDAIYSRIKFFEKTNRCEQKCFSDTLEWYCNKFIEKIYLLTKKNGYNSKEFKKFYCQLSEILKLYYNKLSKKIRIKCILVLNFRRYFFYFFGLRKLLKKINTMIYIKKENISLKIQFSKYCKKIKNKQEKCIIFNTPNHGNLGDHAISLAEEQILNDKNKIAFMVMHHQIEYFVNDLYNFVEKKDVIYITGGGNLGTLWEHEQIEVNKVLEKFKNNKIIIFPQTIFYDKNKKSKYSLKRDKQIYENCRDLIICCRDQKSFDFCKENFNVPILLFSDVVTYLNFSDKINKNRSGILFCFRKDKEKVTVNSKVIDYIKKQYRNEEIKYIDTVFSGKFNNKKGKKFLYDFLKKVKNSKLFVTDRLHGMIFAAITGTPCIAFNNKSGKVKGVYEWISKNNEYIKFVDNNSSLEKNIKAIKLLNINEDYKYNNVEIKRNFEKI